MCVRVMDSYPVRVLGRMRVGAMVVSQWFIQAVVLGDRPGVKLLSSIWRMSSRRLRMTVLRDLEVTRCRRRLPSGVCPRSIWAIQRPRDWE